MKMLKKTARNFGMILCVILLALVILAGYNQIALRIEAGKIVPNGQMVEVNNYKIHVYSEGENRSCPTLVFLSGAGTVAPVYDFKPLYSKLSSSYKIAVVEKAGYGYSDQPDVPRDIDTMVEEERSGLIHAGITGPYILLPHSMSGLEAIYWQQKYPDEVKAIIGIDMATPESYEQYDPAKVMRLARIGSIAVKLGLIRIPGIYPVHTEGLLPDEIKQQKMLIYKNAVNFLFIREGEAVCDNVRVVAKGGNPTCPVLLFCSNGKETGESWISAQENFAEETGAELIRYDCGHYLHYYKSKDMTKNIIKFIREKV